MRIIRGRFYLRLTSNGNLTGEFSHDQSTTIWTESADRIDGGGFSGTYHSTWSENDGREAVLALLKIAHVSGSQRLYNLEWQDPATAENTFIGQAMVVNDMLVGNYRSV